MKSAFGHMPLLVGATLLMAIVAVLVVAERIVGAPRGDLELLAVFLTASGVLSLVLGALLIRWAGGRIGSVRLRLALAYGVGLLVAIVNVFTTSALMFLNTHDLTLLILLLAFAAVISLAFAYAVAGVLTAQLGDLSRAAGRIAHGDMAARVGMNDPGDPGLRLSQRHAELLEPDDRGAAARELGRARQRDLASEHVRQDLRPEA